MQDRINKRKKSPASVPQEPAEAPPSKQSDCLRWSGWDGITGLQRFYVGVVTFPFSVGMLYLGPTIAVDAATPAVRVIATLLFILTGTIAFLVAFGFLFMSANSVLNRTTGELIEERRILGLTINRTRIPIGTVVAIEIQRNGLNRDHVRIYLRNDKVESIPADRPHDFQNALQRAEQMARLFGVEIEEVIPTMSNAERRYRQGVIGFSIGAALVIALVVWLNATRYAVPIIGRLIVLSQYSEDDLVETHCRILTFRATTRAVLPGEQLWAVQADGTDVRAKVCTVVDVSFEYEYEGKHFVSSKFGRYDNYAPHEIQALGPGTETVCYLNPNTAGSGRAQHQSLLPIRNLDERSRNREYCFRLCYRLRARHVQSKPVNIPPGDASRQGTKS